MNIIFAPKQCVIIDMMPEAWLNFEYSYRWIYRLTNVCEQRYILILGERDDEKSAQISEGEPLRYRINRHSLSRAILEVLA